MKSLKINKIAKRNMQNIIGGEETQCKELCICGCSGPSSNASNGNANMKAGKYSPGGGTYYPNSQ